jgi:hypothetical protein
MRTEIPLLQNVRVASPCQASWDAMTPIDEERVRFCEGCQKRVFNLSAMGQAEAEGLLRAHEGHLCVRYYRRHDGTILTNDCPVGLRAARQLILTRTRVSLGLCVLLGVALAQLRSTTETTIGSPAASFPSAPVKGLVPMSNVGAREETAAPLVGESEMGKVRWSRSASSHSAQTKRKHRP